MCKKLFFFKNIYMHILADTTVIYPLVGYSNLWHTNNYDEVAM